ncbi:MAG: hypothetical protein WC716_16840 [Chitinophagaceae bacterium]|jgi:AAA+ ATPase superfamily predicted ATPase
MKDRVIFILGKRGSGKSTLAKRVLSRFSRVIVFDPLKEYREGIIIRSIDALFAFAKNPPETFTLVLRFQNVDAELVALEYETAAKVAHALGDLLLVLEECEMFINSNNQSSFINYLISYGRHENINMLAIGRRPREIPIRFRANFTTIAVFRTTEPPDLNHLEVYGFDPEEIATLPEYEYALIGEPFEDETS